MKPLTENIKSAKAVLKLKHNREGYDKDMPSGMYKTITVEDFVTLPGPYTTFVKYSEITLEPKEKFEEYCKLVKLPTEFKEICADLKVLGRREMKIVVKWKTKV